VFGLGKKRSKFGKWLDKQGLIQNDLANKSKVGRTTVSNMCNDPEYSPRHETWFKIQKALKSWGYNVDRNDFFDL
jgi:DNA-binding XRE family transcriptional regulator